MGLNSFLQRIQLSHVTVNSLQIIGNEVYVLRFNRAKDFLPGQVVAISTDLVLAPRLYSLCSGPEEAEAAVLFTEKTNGMLTPKLAKLKKGDSFWVSAPFGAFLGDENPAWWIASGTGVAPFRSMMKAGLGISKRLIHGGRTLDSFYFSDDFLPIFGTDYIRCCSQESAEGIYAGRLTQWLRDQEKLPGNCMFYLCGSAEMVVEVRDILVLKGVTIERIMSEIYF